MLGKTATVLSPMQRTLLSLRSSISISRRGLSTASGYKYDTINVFRHDPHVLQVELNRPDKSNAMNNQMWTDIRNVFHQITEDSSCRAVVVSGAGKNFTAGLDLSDAAQSLKIGEKMDPSRKGFFLKKLITSYQDTFSAIEQCPKPVIAAVQGACVGAGVDLISACDIRYAAEGAFFSIKEVDIGLAADVGTLQRLPRIIGNDSLIREWAFTGRRWSAVEAQQYHLISQLLSHDVLLDTVLKLAKEISSKSPVAVAGTKLSLNHSRNHSIEESLEWIANWNSLHLQSKDLIEAITAAQQKREPQFQDL